MVDFSKLPLYLGSVTVSPAAMASLTAAGETIVTLLTRHASGDWGDVDDEQRAANWTTIAGGVGLVSSIYRLPAMLLIVTEMTPRQTSVLLPEDIQ